MRLAERLCRLEDLERQGGDCPQCGGKPTIFRLMLDPSAPIEVREPCPRCGRVPPAPFTITVDRRGVDE